MSVKYPHGATKQIEELEPLNAPRLHERIYNEILVAGLDFTPDREDEYQDGIALLGNLLKISADYAQEAGAFGDMFGEYLEATGDTSVKTGRFFTPKDVVTLMTQITLGNQNIDGKPKLLGDPCAGTGRFMLGAAKHFAEKNNGRLNFISVNTDIDRKMFTYCMMNAILHRIPSICIHGDALKVEVWDAFATIPQPGGDVRWARVPLETAKSLVMGMQQVPPTVVPGVAPVHMET